MGVSPLKGRRSVVIGLIAALIICLGVGGVALEKRRRLQHERSRLADAAKSGPVVQVTPARLSPTSHAVVLTAEARPFAVAALVAKISGYVTQVAVDKGDHVEAGQTVAVIAAPETTEQYNGAIADSLNKEHIAQRMADLYKRKLVSTQDYEQSRSEARVAKARVAQLGAEKGYQIVQAPFAGTVVARNIDPGSLVSSSSSAILTIAQLDRLRIYGYIDQRFAYSVKPGLPVELSMHERPSVRLKAALTRITGELDPRTRTMLIEVDYDNSKNDIVPGSFVQMTLSVPAQPTPEVPVDAVVQREDKYFVPVIENSVVKYRSVDVGTTDGHNVEILNGLKAGELVARNIGDDLSDGQHVRVAPQTAH